MLGYKNEIVKLIIIFFCLILISLIILHDSYSIYNLSSVIDNNLKQRKMSEEVYKDVVKITTVAKEYMLNRSPASINEFRDLSSAVIKRQLELHSVTDSSKKQETMDLIEVSRVYISFVEKELIPASSTGNNDFMQLELRLHELSQDLILKAGNVYILDRVYEENFFQGVGSKGNKYLFLQLLSILTLSLLIFELYKLIKPVMLRNCYLEKLLQFTKNPVFITDNKGVFVDCNKSLSELMEINRDFIANRNIGEITAVYPHAHNIMQPIYDVLINGSELTNHHVTYNHAGKKIEIVADYIPVYIMKKLFGIIVIAAQAEAQKDKHVLLDTLETERKRISIEIHDWIGRHMSTMIHSLDYILRLSENDHRDKLIDNLKTLQGHCQNAAIEMRGIMNDIHPYLIDRVGLISALESYITTFERLYGIKVYALYQDRSLRVKKKNEIIIYRIIQEALTNVAKHSRATEIDIDFTVSHDTLKIEVTDNGGSAGDFSVGNGLWGMRERANLIGGDIIFTIGESGFRVALTVPVSPGGV
ncbi:MAG: histidine kinase [Bacillota bacterium]